MKIAVRADGGNQIGIGHIMRTLVLAKELAKTNDVFYICKISKESPEKYSKGIEIVKKSGFNIKTISETNILDELKFIKADCLITDSYDVDEDYFNNTKKMFEFTGYIDDLNLYNFNVDFIINQNIGSENYKYNTNKDTKLFLGTDYIMLREEFRNASFNLNINKKVKNIMITVGGSDSNGITNRIYNYIKDLSFEFHIIIGPSFKKENIQSLIKLIKKGHRNIKLHINEKIINVMKKCDVAISACGSTLYELAILGIPTLGIIVSDNQELTAYKMEQRNIIFNLGWYNELNKEKLLYYLNLICEYKNRKLMIQNYNIFNKYGVEKLACLINDMYKEVNY